MLSSVTLNRQVTKIVMIQVLNFLKCQQSHTILQAMSLSLSLVRFNMQGGHWGFQYYRPHPHKTANYRPIFIFSTVPVSPVKIFANTIETGNLEKFL